MYLAYIVLFVWNFFSTVSSGLNLKDMLDYTDEHPELLEPIESIDPSNLTTDPSILEDAHLDTYSLIRKYKYPCQIHRVTTEDGYILEIHRIPHGREKESPGPRPVVFLQHGLLCSSADWVMMGPGKGLGYILADAGYDVWMGNARGNTYSRRHTILNPNSPAFWDFSWHEIGYYDLPASIDFVLRETKVSKMQYVGHSQGTTTFFVMTSTRPEYNDKISAMQALAPVAYCGNIRSPFIKAIGPFTLEIEVLMKLFGQKSFMTTGLVNLLAGQNLCLEESIFQPLCSNIVFLLCGYDSAQLNLTTLPIMFGHDPAGASSKQLVHYGQLYESKNFTLFDYGPIENKIKYGTYQPPAYNLSAIRTPLFLHYGDNDLLATPNDVQKLHEETSKVSKKYKVPLNKFSHEDFFLATDIKFLLYDLVLKLMNQFKTK